MRDEMEDSKCFFLNLSNFCFRNKINHVQISFFWKSHFKLNSSSGLLNFLEIPLCHPIVEARKNTFIIFGQLHMRYLWTDGHGRKGLRRQIRIHGGFGRSRFYHGGFC